MFSNASKPENMVIPPYRGHVVQDNHTISHEKSRSAMVPEYSKPKTYCSAPNLQQVVVVPREARNPRGSPTCKTQFRVGKVGLQRSPTWPKHEADKDGHSSLWRKTRSPQKPKALKSTPNLRNQLSTRAVQSHVDNTHLRRRQTWPRQLVQPKNKGRGLKHYIHPTRPRELSNSTPKNDPADRPSTPPPRFIGPNESLEPLETLKKLKPSFDDVAPFWEGYNKMADFEDKEFVKALGVNLDTLLIFAGLFSAIDTAFIVEALQTLQPDQAEKTNDLIRSVILILHNSTFADNSLHDETFSATPGAFRASVVFFVSLTFSLTAAFGAVMGKQWLNYYEREGRLKPPPARGRERQKKFEARDKWHMEGVIETLPTLLQISLFLFLVALVDFLWSIHLRLAYIVLAFSSIPFVFYVVTTTIAVIDPISPFQTRLSISIQRFWHWIKTRLIARIRLTAVTGLLESAMDSIMSFVLDRLWVWRPPLGWLCAMLPAAILWLILLLPLAVSSLYRSLQWLFRRLSHTTHTFTGKAITSSPSNSHPITGPPSYNTADIANLRCLDTYIQQASIPQDLPTILAALDSFPVNPLIEADQPLVESLVELSIKRILTPWYHYVKTNKQASNSIDISQLLKILHLAYTSFGYGSHLGSRDRYLLNLNADRSIIQELFDALFRSPLDVDSASMAADVIPLSRFEVTCTEANLEALCQCLERPSNTPRYYLPYLTLLSFATRHGPIIDEAKSYQILHGLASSMWIDEEADLDHNRGKIRLKVLPERLGASDEYQFSKYLWHWRQGAFGQKYTSAQWLDVYYTEAIARLLDSHPNNPLWPEQLEKDDHISLLLGLAVAGWHYTTCFNALYGFLVMWHSRSASADSTVRTMYLNPRAVAAVLDFWESTHGRRTTNRVRLAELTVSYLEGAGLQLLKDRDLTSLIQEFEILGGRYADVTTRLRLLQNGRSG